MKKKLFRNSSSLSASSARGIYSSLAGGSFNLLNVLFIAGFLLQGCSREKTLPAAQQQEQQLTSANAAALAGTPLPGGRAYYVVTLMGGAVNAKFVRIAQYSFTAGAGSTGTVTEQFKFWDQVFTGDAYSNKVATGYTTGNCLYNNCTIKTPIGYQPGQAWSTLSGTYYIDVNGRVVITWTGGSVETWTISYPKTYYAMFTIFNSNYNVQHGWGFGSNTNFNTGATIAQIKAAGSLNTADYWQNAYGVADQQSTGQWWNMPAYNPCSTPSMQITESGAACSANKWHSYVAGDPATDKRKNYWNHQLDIVTCADVPGPCISPQAGHTVAMLQVLDDAGVFRGWVAVEASLHTQATGNAVVGTFYYVKS